MHRALEGMACHRGGPLVAHQSHGAILYTGNQREQRLHETEGGLQHNEACTSSQTPTKREETLAELRLQLFKVRSVLPQELKHVRRAGLEHALRHVRQQDVNATLAQPIGTVVLRRVSACQHLDASVNDLCTNLLRLGRSLSAIGVCVHTLSSRSSLRSSI